MNSKKKFFVFVAILSFVVFLDLGSSFLKLDNRSCKDATSVSASNEYSCILKENGNLDCEGDSVHGSFLYSDYGSGDAKQVSTERTVKCVLKDTGNVDCGNKFGFSTGDAQEVSVGSFRISPQSYNSEAFACIRRSGGGLKCKSTVDSGSDSADGDIESLGGNVKQISVDDGEACVVNNNGNVNCSHSTIANSGNPVAQNPDYSGGDAEQVAFSEDNTLNSNDDDAYVVTRCILKDKGNVSCIGNSTYYGNGHINDYNKGDAKKVVADGFQTCVLKDNSNLNGGDVECWGSDYYQPVGGGNLENISFTYDKGDAVDVSIGHISNYICVAKESGDTSCYKVGSGFSDSDFPLTSKNGQDFNHSCVDPIDRVSKNGWSQSGKGAEKSRYTENLSHVDKGLKKESNFSISINQEVSVHKGKIYGTNGSKIYHLEASNFSRGVVSSNSDISKGVPAAIERSVYALSYNGSSSFIHRYQSSNLSNQYDNKEFSSQPPGLFRPVVSEEYVYAVTDGGPSKDNVYQFNRTNLSEEVATFSAEKNITTAPAVNGQSLYVGGEGNTVYRLNSSNVSQNLSSYNMGSSVGTPIISGNSLYVYEDVGPLYRLNSSNVSQEISSSSIKGSAPDSKIASNNEYLYLATMNNNLYQINASNISHIISNFSSGNSLSDPAVTDNYVYVSDSNGDLYQLNSTNVSQVNDIVGSVGNNSPVISSDFVYSGESSGILYRLGGKCNPSVSGNWIVNGVHCFFESKVDIGARDLVMENNANVTINPGSNFKARRIILKDSAGIFEIF